jgi:organic radical activating enzyme
MILQVTQQCNLRCQYCAYSGAYYNRTHNSARMSFETAKRAIDFLLARSHESDHVHVGFYGGEPLLEFDLIKRCVDYVKKSVEGRSITFGITTNATLLNDEKILEDRLHGDFNQTVRFDAGDFSGGERKKLAVARAILKNTPIIIMDEAAADYDYEAEQRLSHLLADAFPDKMILYITHNYSYLDLFDRVYRLSDGRLYSLTEAEIESLTRCEREGPRPGEKAQVSG